MKASVIIPTYNSEQYIHTLLEVVSMQKTTEEFEILVVDSTSTDATQKIIQKSLRCQLITIPKEEFNHGATRNFAISKTCGEYIVFLTHDALPITSTWLQEYIDIFDANPDIANVFGKQIPYPDALPSIARDVEHTFAQFSEQMDVTGITCIDASTPQWIDFNSNANAAYRRSAITETLFEPLIYAEDRKIAADLITAGYRRAYAEHASVYHSHTYPLHQYTQRYFDEFRGLQLATGVTPVISIISLFPRVVFRAAKDILYIWTSDFTRKQSIIQKVYGSLYAVPFQLSRAMGALLAKHQKYLPKVFQKMLSLEGN